MSLLSFDEYGGVRDIRPIFAGEEKCAPGHSFGPYIRDHFIIHFVLDGRGVLEDKFGTHEIRGGELFVIRPGESTVYTADTSDPWHYMWLAFVGDEAARFDTDRSVYRAPSDFMSRLRAFIERGVISLDAYLSVIYELLHQLFADKEPPPDRLSQIRSYIDYNYMDEISVDGLTSKFGFERSYLYRMFKKKYGVGVKEYIISVRAERAKQFLLSGRTVSETAYLVGYRDEFNFSRAFKKVVGMSPSDYKKREKQQNG